MSPRDAVAALEQVGLFTFSYDFLDAVTQHAEQIVGRGSITPDTDALMAHYCVGAAEFATLEQAVSNPDLHIELPINVKVGHALLAALKYDCTALGCLFPFPVTLSGRYLTDRITLFSGDAEKISKITGEGHEISSPGELHSLVRLLEGAYRADATDLFKSFSDGYALRIQAVLWRLQLTIDNRPEFRDPLDTACFDTAHSLGLLENAERPSGDVTSGTSRVSRSAQAIKPVSQEEELLTKFEEMTLIELAHFVKAFEEKFEIEVEPPAAARMEAAATEEEGEFDVILTGAGERKIQVIKVVRELTTLGLKGAKDLVDSAPTPTLERVSKEAATKAAGALKSAGASVEVRGSESV